MAELERKLWDFYDFFFRVSHVKAKNKLLLRLLTQRFDDGNVEFLFVSSINFDLYQNVVSKLPPRLPRETRGGVPSALA